MGNLFRRFINDQAGVTAIEYGLIAARHHHHRRDKSRHEPLGHIPVGRHCFGLIVSAPPVWRLDFGRCQTRASGGARTMDRLMVAVAIIVAVTAVGTCRPHSSRSPPL
jgi:hypothetical protein